MANRERQRRYKERQKALPKQGVTNKALPEVAVLQEDYEIAAHKPPKRGKDIKLSFNAGDISRCSKMRDMSDVLAKPKRGKDIKCFEDLPVDVQQTIDRISESPEEKRRRTGIAIHYQHVVDRFEPNSDQDLTRLMAKAGPGHVRVSKPGDDDYVPMCETTRRYIDGRGACS